MGLSLTLEEVVAGLKKHEHPDAVLTGYIVELWKAAEENERKVNFLEGKLKQIYRAAAKAAQAPAPVAEPEPDTVSSEEESEEQGETAAPSQAAPTPTDDDGAAFIMAGIESYNADPNEAALRNAAASAPPQARKPNGNNGQRRAQPKPPAAPQNPMPNLTQTVIHSDAGGGTTKTEMPAPVSPVSESSVK